jgi:hypothetical protein
MEKCNDTRRILGYCRDALDEVKKDEPTGAIWERRWTSLMALLRTACEILKREAPDWWKKHISAPNASVRGRDPKKRWRPDIFGQFIWTDSNLFLHEGKNTTDQSAIVHLQGTSYKLSLVRLAWAVCHSSRNLWRHPFHRQKQKSSTI